MPMLILYLVKHYYQQNKNVTINYNIFKVRWGC